jgi:hypothetical protein
MQKRSVLCVKQGVVCGAAANKKFVVAQLRIVDLSA